MTDDQRDEILTELRVTVATVSTTLAALSERVGEKLQVLDQSQRNLFQQSGACKKRLSELELWQREVSSLGSARSSAFSRNLAIAGLLFSVVAGICGGIFSLIQWASG